MRTIAIINQKGGCGKTTTAINLAAVFAKRGFRTLLIDMDPQSHCAAGLGVPERVFERDVTDALLTPPEHPLDAERMLWRVSRDLDLLPSRMRLAGLEAARGGLADTPDKEFRLASVLARLNVPSQADPERAGRFDVCLIDCPPGIGLLTYNALAAAREILIPVETSFFSLRGAAKQVNTVRAIARRLGVRIRPRVVATIYDREVAIAKDLLRELQDRFGNALAPSVIRQDAKLKEAASFGRAIIDHDPDSMGAEDYESLCEWLTLHADIEHGEFEDASTGEDDVDLPGMGSREPAEAEAGPSPTPNARPEAPEVQTKPMTRLEELARRARAMSGHPGFDPTTPATGVSARPVAVLSSRLGGGVALQAPPAEARAVERPAVSESVKRLFGCRATSRGALFVQPTALGRSVCVAGDFNGWSASSTPMRRNEGLGVFELQLDLPAGEHRYRLVVDGVWRLDEHNPHRAETAGGQRNNVIHLPARAP